jgi:hypothetical protein
MCPVFFSFNVIFLMPKVVMRLCVDQILDHSEQVLIDLFVSKPMFVFFSKLLIFLKPFVHGANWNVLCDHLNKWIT